MPTSVTSASPLGAAQRVAPGEHERALPVGAGQRLVDRARREPEVGGLATGRPSRESACSSVHSRSWPKAGSQAVQPGWPMPIEGVTIDWWAPPSGASETPLGVPIRIDCPPA